MTTLTSDDLLGSGKRNETDRVFPVEVCTMDVIAQAVENKSATYLVWWDEGEFVEHDTHRQWMFNEQHNGSEGSYGRFSPLLLDMQTANLMVKVRAALSDKDKFDRMVASDRGSFGRIVEFCWGRVRSNVSQPLARIGPQG